MPLARIVTRIPESAEPLVAYLTERGYQVQTIAPGQAEALPADLEITLETCTRDEALERAAHLAPNLDADILVAPGALENTVADDPAERPMTLSQPEVPALSRLSERSRILQQSVRNWRRESGERLVAVKNRLTDDARALQEETLDAAVRARTRAGKWIRETWQITSPRIVSAIASARAKLLQAYQQVSDRVRLRIQLARERTSERQRQFIEHERQREQAALAAQQRERQEREAAAQARLREQQEQAARLNESRLSADHEHDEEVVPGTIATAALLRQAPRPRSSLVAYTRHSDWKMAFMGAAAASLLIMVISFGFMSHKPPGNDVQQKLPVAAAPEQVKVPALIVPPVSPNIAPPEIAVKKTKPVPPKARPARAPEPDPDDEYFEEVVVQHYSTQQSAKAHTGNDGVKRISDLE